MTLMKFFEDFSNAFYLALVLLCKNLLLAYLHFFFFLQSFWCSAYQIQSRAISSSLFCCERRKKNFKLLPLQWNIVHKNHIQLTSSAAHCISEIRKIAMCFYQTRIIYCIDQACSSSFKLIFSVDSGDWITQLCGEIVEI